MRKLYSIELLRKLHNSRFTYCNEEYDEIYAWYGGPDIKIYDYTGEEVGKANILKAVTNEEYNLNEEVIERDVHTSIDSIVHALYNDEIDDRNIIIKNEE